MLNEKNLNRYIFILAILGLAISCYLAYEYNLGKEIPCLIGGGGCDTVKASRYSSFFGISTPFYGILFYLTVIVLSIVRTIKIHQRQLHIFQFLMAITGLLVSIYLTSLEAFVIGAYCIWCVGSATISTSIFGISLLSVMKLRKPLIHE